MLAGYVRGEYKTFLLLPYLSYKDDIYKYIMNSYSTAFINIYVHALKQIGISKSDKETHPCSTFMMMREIYRYT